MDRQNGHGTTAEEAHIRTQLSTHAPRKHHREVVLTVLVLVAIPVSICVLTGAFLPLLAQLSQP